MKPITPKVCCLTVLVGARQTDVRNTKTTTVKIKKTSKADPVCFFKRTIGKAMWQSRWKDTNLDLIPPASVTDALIRQRGNMFFCNTFSYLKPLLMNFTGWMWVRSPFLLETTPPPKKIYLKKNEINK